MDESRLWRSEDWKEADIIYSAFLAKPGVSKYLISSEVKETPVLYLKVEQVKGL
jgi:hypothetical protein